MSPDFKKHLWDELTSCVKYVSIDHNTLLKMPVYIRKFYIAKHNESVKEEASKAEMSKKKRKKGGLK